MGLHLRWKVSNDRKRQGSYTTLPGLTRLPCWLLWRSLLPHYQTALFGQARNVPNGFDLRIAFRVWQPSTSMA